MYKVIIFGTGAAATEVLNILRKDACEIVCFLDNNSRRWGKYNNIDVKDPNEIRNIKYDYIIIASQYNDEIYNQLISLEVDDKKILQFFKYMNKKQDYVRKLVNVFSESKVQSELIATGLSYCQSAINMKMLKMPGFIFAYGSQDLYYDYNIVKYIIEKYKDKCIKIKYCVIGLAYYSFQYDLSLSVMKDRVYQYYRILGLYHHNKEIPDTCENYLISEDIANKILFRDPLGKAASIQFKDKSIEEKYEMGLRRADSDCNKNYPLTVEENKQIFEDYLKLLKANNIKAIVAVFPTTKYYSEKFSPKIENEFKGIIKEFNDKYDFKYIDYFRSNIFDDNDFSDVSHLNNRGAEKFTNILNEYIQ